MECCESKISSKKKKCFSVQIVVQYMDILG